jgi:hypothetical protein
MLIRTSTFQRASLAAFMVFVLLAVAAGCGGGDGSGSESKSVGDKSTVNTHTGSLSKKEFIRKAGAICLAAHERSAAEFAKYVNDHEVPTSGPGLIAKATDVVAKVFVPVYELQIEKINALGAPKGDLPQVNTMLTAMQQGIERAKQHPLQFIRRPTAFSRASKLATAYGLSACGTGNT